MSPSHLVTVPAPPGRPADNGAGTVADQRLPARIAAGAAGAMLVQLVLLVGAAVLEVTPDTGLIDFGLAGLLLLGWLCYGGWMASVLLVAVPAVVAWQFPHRRRTSWIAMWTGLLSATLLHGFVVFACVVGARSYLAVSPTSYAVTLGAAVVLPTLILGRLWVGVGVRQLARARRCRCAECPARAATPHRSDD